MRAPSTTATSSRRRRLHAWTRFPKRASSGSSGIPSARPDLAGYVVFRAEGSGQPVRLNAEPIVDSYMSDTTAKPAIATGTPFAPWIGRQRERAFARGDGRAVLGVRVARHLGVMAPPSHSTPRASARPPSAPLLGSPTTRLRLVALPSRFVKMAGGGNDFLLFEADGRPLSEEDLRRVALLCRRGLSVGADGALFLSGGESARPPRLLQRGRRARVVLRERDALRGALRRDAAASSTDSRAVLETGWAPIAARVDADGDARSAAALPGPRRTRCRSPATTFPATATPIHVGVPHLVVFVRGDSRVA